MSEELIIVNSVIGPTQLIIAFSCAEFDALSWVTVALFDHQVSAVAFRIIHGPVEPQKASMGSKKDQFSDFCFADVKTVFVLRLKCCSNLIRYPCYVIPMMQSIS